MDEQTPIDASRVVNALADQVRELALANAMLKARIAELETRLAEAQ